MIADLLKKKWLLAALIVMLSWAVLGAIMARAQSVNDNSLITFPENYTKGSHYNTIDRGNAREEMFTSAEAIAAAKNGQPLPSGTVIVNEWYENGRLTHYFVMEKQTGWGGAYAPDLRAGDWRFRDFGPDKIPHQDDGTGCMACHRSQANGDFVWTHDQMKRMN